MKFEEHLLRLLQETDRRVEQRFVAQERAVVSALAAADKAVAKSEAAAEIRFASVNEFRNVLADQARHLITRTEVEAQLTALAEKLDATAARLDRIEGRGAGASTLTGTLIAVAGVFVTFGTVIAILVVR